MVTPIYSSISYICVLINLIGQTRQVPTTTNSVEGNTPLSTILTIISSHPNLRPHPPYPSSASTKWMSATLAETTQNLRVVASANLVDLASPSSNPIVVITTTRGACLSTSLPRPRVS